VPHDTTAAFPSDSTGPGGFRWTDQPALGVTNTGDYWLRDLTARDPAADSARVDAATGARPIRNVNSHSTHFVPVEGGPGPGLASSLTWSGGHRANPTSVIRLHLTNVGSLRVLLGGAGFRPGSKGTLEVTTDGPTTIRLGDQVVQVGSGEHVVPFSA
jgi:hypothetical protein